MVCFSLKGNHSFGMQWRASFLPVNTGKIKQTYSIILANGISHSKSRKRWFGDARDGIVLHGGRKRLIEAKGATLSVYIRQLIKPADSLTDQLPGAAQCLFGKTMLIMTTSRLFDGLYTSRDICPCVLASYPLINSSHPRVLFLLDFMPGSIS